MPTPCRRCECLLPVTLVVKLIPVQQQRSRRGSLRSLTCSQQLAECCRLYHHQRRPCPVVTAARNASSSDVLRFRGNACAAAAPCLCRLPGKLSTTVLTLRTDSGFKITPCGGSYTMGM